MGLLGLLQLEVKLLWELYVPGEYSIIRLTVQNSNISIKQNYISVVYKSLHEIWQVNLIRIILMQGNWNNVNKVNSNGVKVRGKDIVWEEIHHFENANEYMESEIAKKIEKEFTARKQREYSYADVKMYNCKFSRKVGYLPCPWQIKLSFMSDSPAVTVETIDGVEEHKHEVDPQHAANQGAVFKWTDEQTNVIEHDLKNGRYPNVILRNLIKANVFGLRKPSKVQLYNKITAVKKKLFPSHQILNTHQLRQKVSALLEVPD